MIAKMRYTVLGGPTVNSTDHPICCALDKASLERTVQGVWESDSWLLRDFLLWFIIRPDSNSGDTRSVIAAIRAGPSRDFLSPRTAPSRLDLPILNYVRIIASRIESYRPRIRCTNPQGSTIAAELRALGLRTARGHEFGTRDVRNVRHTIGLARPSPLDAGELTVSQVAGRLGVKPSAVYYWLRAGDLPYRKRATGAVCIPFSTAIEATLRARPAVSRHVNQTQKKATGGAV